MDLFRAISKGTKFDLSRFSADANRFHLKPTQSVPAIEDNSVKNAQELRNINQINVMGQDIPNPINQFSELTSMNFAPKILENLTNLGFTTPTPVQMQAIPVQMQSRNLLACAPTGSGKTLSFVLPIIATLRQHRTGGPRALILVPTRELAMQVFADIKSVSGGISLRTAIGSSRISDKAAAKRLANSDILVTTPNRLLFMSKNSELEYSVDLSKILCIVADECDKLFQVGKRGFRDQVGFLGSSSQFGEVYGLCTHPRLRNCFFSATFDELVEEWCRLNLDDVIIMHVGLRYLGLFISRNSTVKTVDQQLLFVTNDIGKLFAIREQFQSGIKTPALIFVESKTRANELLNELLFDGISVDVLHSGRPPKERDQVVEKFRTGEVSVLISTDLVARGMDFSAVNFILNYDMPRSAVDYIHRIGRTGRAGRRGEAITYYTDEDMERGIDHITKIINSSSHIPAFLSSSRKRKAVVNNSSKKKRST